MRAAPAPVGTAARVSQSGAAPSRCRVLRGGRRAWAARRAPERPMLDALKVLFVLTGASTYLGTPRRPRASPPHAWLSPSSSWHACLHAGLLGPTRTEWTSLHPFCFEPGGWTAAVREIRARVLKSGCKITSVWGRKNKSEKKKKADIFFLLLF